MKSRRFKLLHIPASIAVVFGGIWGCDSGRMVQNAQYQRQSTETGSYFDPSRTGYLAPGTSAHARASRTTVAPVGPSEEIWIITPPPDRTGISKRDGVDLLGGFGGDGLVDPLIFDAFDEDATLRDLVDPCGGIIGIPSHRGTSTPAFVPVPLEHTSVEAEISAFVATVDVEQQFHNPYNSKIEAVYVFPLPQDAAVNEFIMTIGERRIRGIIRPREEAEQIYLEARRQGYVASLLEQQRPNIFTQKVANIEPGKRIDVNIRYFHTLAYDDGWYEWVFPMVVGPRYNPPGSNDPINPVSRTGDTRFGGTRGGTNVPYLAPHDRSGHDISLTCEIDAGVNIEEVLCNSHAVDVDARGSSLTRITLSPRDVIPNKDFVLRYRVAGDRIKTAMLTQHDPSKFGGAGHFALMIYPPADLSYIDRRPLEMIFVLDCSGSMEGEPLALAKRAVERALRQLREDDAFQMIRFSDRATMFAAKPQAVNSDTVTRGIDFLNSLSAGGGTRMLDAMDEALDSIEESRCDRDRYIVFLTDGFIGNEDEVLGLMQERLDRRDGHSTRIFSFGIGSSPNRFLLERMAGLGGGVVAYVGLGDSPAEVMDRFIERSSHPALKDISIDFGGMDVRDVQPGRVPDLFAGRPVIITGRYHGEASAEVGVEGVAGTRELSIPVEVSIQEGAISHDGIACIWARSAIAGLENRAMVDDDREIAHVIEELALRYGLASARTSFIAVDGSERTHGAFGTMVPVAVPVPDGVQYQTTVDQ